MSPQEREKIISRLLASGQFVRADKVYWMGEPPPEYKAWASEIAYASVEEGMSQRDAEKILLLRKLWYEDEEDKIKKIQSDCEEFKFQMYINRFGKEAVNALKKQLRAAENALNELSHKKHALFSYTMEAVHQVVKARAEAAWSVRVGGKRGGMLWEDDSWLMDERTEFWVAQKTASRVDEVSLRYLARNSPWIEVWNTRCDANVFGLSPNEMSSEQRGIISWSMLYENVRANPECPEDSVIDDDDLMDGWLIKQKRERGKHNAGSEIDELAGVNRNKSEIFIPVSPRASFEKIDSFNDDRAKHIKQQRIKVIQEKGYVPEAELPDVKQQLRMQLAQMEAQRGK